MIQVKIVIPHTFRETFHKHPTQAKVEVEMLNRLTFGETFFSTGSNFR